MKVALIGYGRMGRTVERLAREREHEVGLRLTAADNADGSGITARSMAEIDVAIEFTAPAAAPDNIRRCAEAGVPVVSGTTGWYDQLESVRAAVEDAGGGLLYAPNFSIGTQLFFRLARAAARLAERAGEYDAFVLEAHHRHKADHPSGTAKRLAQIVLEELTRKRRWEVGPGEGPVDPEALQVAVIRAGKIPGTHSLGLEGPDDRIELRHEARGRDGFARGAVMAAEWLCGKSGCYTLDDMLSDTLDR